MDDDWGYPISGDLHILKPVLEVLETSLLSLFTHWSDLFGVGEVLLNGDSQARLGLPTILTQPSMLCQQTWQCMAGEQTVDPPSKG